ncbi:SDR family oxidoreductase [Pseudomonas sp. CBSPBW29]|uniref:SDR family NAD(P)-dependent oxidoreductase n=1 Tax=Pseudomonas TaxID=286 RepID=UPI0021AC528D|nr:MULTISPECIES: SDR family oxidoreductase [unclassified Pseudomonas]WEL41948.1 SDR family oxidoreductase [Pseudomonas sp. CBSPBW29]WEL72199.1 SDR family oxidoreductase [Pseudomonas sp. CBSPCGW29]WEL79098.1 SDR family oxidoreductase [Pseudomonas sp. CBSPAW29]WEL82252.1 SDR family oxidoreductase [Pseudomonas sp. CBSPCAW29]WEL90727.1 SDR family oxidoreductase [Pseudomonas sp. CBSPCBW29]
MSQHKGYALITGASSGIGAVYADRLARAGYDLILVARNQQRLEQLATRLKASTQRDVEVIAADLNLPADLARIAQLAQKDSRISLLVNNAGVGATASLLESDADKMDAMILLNVLALTRLAKAAATNFVAQGRGTIINIGSIVALAPKVLNGVYGGTKAFVQAFSESLQHELSDKGVVVQVVLPGATATAFWDIAGLPVNNLPETMVMTTENLVDAALAGLAQGEAVTIPSLPDSADWDTYERARLALGPNLSHREPAARYGLK